MKIQHTTTVFILILIEVKCTDLINNEKLDTEQKSNDKSTETIKSRFSQDLDDNEWHKSHLKDPDFMEQNVCLDENIDESIIRYKSVFANDGAFVNFVSSDPIPFNESQITSNKCPKGNVTVKKNQAVLKSNDSKSENLKLNVTKDERYNDTNTATTLDAKATEDSKDKSDNATAEISRRASEYQFSSVEYYDEKVDFDASACPDAVDVIELEIDQLRSYDIDCEAILEWRSLE